MKLSNDILQKRQPGGATGKSQPPSTNLQLKGFWLLLARGAWLAFVLPELGMLLLVLLASRGQGMTFCPFIMPVSCAVTPATAQALHHLGLSPATYDAYNLVLTLLESLAYLGVGGFLFWRASNEPIALVTSFFLVSIGLGPFLTSTAYHLDLLFVSVYVIAIFTALGYFLVTFPDGRFVPGWTWLLVVLWAVRTLLYLIPGPANIAFWPPALNIVDEAVSYGGALVVLVYRYRRVFRPAQRQQAKWVLFGFGTLLVVILLYDLIAVVVPGLAAPDSLYQLANTTLTALTFLLLPLSVAMAILRARLWEIDVIIRRTLVYSVLTLLLVLLYWGLVLALGSLLRGLLGQQQNPLVLVASTLLIAALFQPLRRGVQRVIDRRFYRRKYDAARTLAAFSATLRSEVDLDQVREQLVATVQETMQPAHLSLWLRPPATNKGASPWNSSPPVP
ncbi:MAG TPA: hypothetical protein VF043_33325 [Ktedonobacteraceae bacterium]